ncbi:hypothetical protein HanRHA438_Chr06g0262741 [Helianthus annuus]|nr:hypothetical protein HanRHA438_Chr06g0262741 [Helianthus annuus]
MKESVTVTVKPGTSLQIIVVAVEGQGTGVTLVDVTPHGFGVEKPDGSGSNVSKESTDPNKDLEAAIRSKKSKLYGSVDAFFDRDFLKIYLKNSLNEDKKKPVDIIDIASKILPFPAERRLLSAAFKVAKPFAGHFAKQAFLFILEIIPPNLPTLPAAEYENHPDESENHPTLSEGKDHSDEPKG